MVRLETVKASNLELVKHQPLVAVFFGGTSGIGEYTIRSLAKTNAQAGKDLRLYIVGRNSSAAQKIIGDCQQICPTGQFVFVKVDDLSLLKNVDIVCDRIIDMEKAANTNGGTPRIDVLVMSQACTVFQPRTETAEGLDFLMSLMYYSRMRAIMKLSPLLMASETPAHVVSVYAAGMEAKLIGDDLALRKPGNYSYMQARSHICYMKTQFMESLAKQYQGKISFVHVFPGLVITPAYQDQGIPTWFKWLWTIIGGILARLYAVPAEECGARTLSLATSRYPPQKVSGGETRDTGTIDGIALGTDGIPGSGAYAINWNGESISLIKAYSKIQKEELSKQVWEHTNRAFDTIAAGQVFQD